MKNFPQHMSVINIAVIETSRGTPSGCNVTLPQRIKILSELYGVTL